MNKEQNKGKYEKINSEKNTTIALIDKDVVVLSIEGQKCEHVTNNDVEWVVNSATPPPPYYPYEGVVYHVKTYKKKFNEIVEPHEKKTTGEHRIVSFKNNWASDEGEPKGLD